MDQTISVVSLHPNAVGAIVPDEGHLLNSNELNWPDDVMDFLENTIALLTFPNPNPFYCDQEIT